MKKNYLAFQETNTSCFF